MVEDFFFAVAASIMAAQALLPKTMGICHIWRYHDGRTLTGMGAGLILDGKLYAGTTYGLIIYQEQVMAIAQKVAEGHHGKIWAESRDGVNSFFVSLPSLNMEK